MKRKLFGAIAIAAVVAMTGCSEISKPVPPMNPAPATSTAPGVSEVRHQLNDGRTVVCLLWDEDAGYDSGIDCDWANAK